MIRKIISSCLLLLTALLLAGCGSKSKVEAEGDAPKSAATRLDSSSPPRTAEANPARSIDTPHKPTRETPRQSQGTLLGRSPEIEAAAQAIKKLGGILMVEDNKVPGSPIRGVMFQNSGITGDKLEPLPRITTLRDVRLSCYRITDISYVCQCGNLQYLHLKGSGKLSDDALQPITNLHHLETLSLPHFTGDSGLAHVQKLTSLTHLDLGGNQKITDGGLDHLADLKSLTHLTLPSKISDAGLSRLSALTSLEYLNCSGTHGITDDGLRHLASMNSLRELDLTGGQKLTDAGLEHLQSLKDMRSLKLSRGARKVTDQAVIRLKRAIPGLEVVR